MANVKIAGDAVVITSTMKLEDLNTLKKYRPDALVLKDENKEPIFAVGTTSTGRGDINEFGVTFDSEARDDTKKAVVTVVVPTGIADIKAYVADKLGMAINNLNKLEEGLTGVIDEINAEKAKVLESITVVE